MALSPNDDKRIILDEGIHKGALAAGDHVVGYRMAAPCWRASIQASIVKPSKGGQGLLLKRKRSVFVLVFPAF